MIESILALTVPFVFVIIIVWLGIYEKQKRHQLQADLAAKALEKGQPIPANLFSEPKKKRNPLNIGIILIAVGVGTSLFFLLISLTGNDKEALGATSLGIIPFLIGMAYIIIHFIEKGKTASENAK